ncbi:hypothetical protein [Chryseobacterium sp. ON_d1]|uniref:hypothetical protein n=1 Tax=Chryseobacterium sp. ON_d1 TaxID=2583211 RepID=UPI001173BEA2|nr:hypothetical protein [Chryseobacterium sp. ON_d1]GEJ44212.1 hypothetical protein CRS_08200 [Chryseobacterium sp. ON_d1]
MTFAKIIFFISNKKRIRKLESLNQKNIPSLAPSTNQRYIRIRNCSLYPFGKKGFKSKVPICEIINYILYKLKTSTQWYPLPENGLPLAMSISVCGNHNDLFNIEEYFEKLTNFLRRSGISLDSLLNFDSGFDAENLRSKDSQLGIIVNIAHNKRNSGIDNDHYFDEELYKKRYTIEITNAWLDSFRSILNRFDTILTSLIGFNYLAFIVIACKKFIKRKSR